MKSPISEAYRIWTTLPRPEWDAELNKYPRMADKPGRGVCSREDVHKALRLALSAQQMGGEYMRMGAENRFQGVAA